MNKNIIVSVVVVLLVLVIGWYGWSKQGGSSETGGDGEAVQTIKIGFSLPLTGDLAFLGESYQNAINLALSEVTDTKYKYEVVFEDDKFDPAKAVTSANKLISVDKVDVISSFGSPAGNTVSPIAEKVGIPHINGAASDPNIAVGDYNFIHWTPPYEESKVLVTELKKRGIKSVILFEQNQPGVMAVTKVLREDLADAGITLAGSETFNTGMRDFRSLISKQKNTPADLYLLEVTSPELEILAKQIREAGITTAFSGIESMEFTDQPELFEGFWYVNAADPADWFVEKYTSTYNVAPKLAAGNGYDVVKMVVAAVEKAGDGQSKPTGEEIMKELAKLKGLSGAMGKLTMDQDGVVITKAVVRVMTNGQPVTVQN
ncbi:MAG: hypothetical protein A2589_01890 [Candidatus Vogelbacteria bacterium RIFOXYD1_FULL_46_19]|uniref:Leucine-binding protein domain-containing protein n=1 Tax=Candidatus Vogelbacteria bacterium RIFOXYD1_FULL_46_19 TaxID=1802439 RepID=A0A1G2QHY7_9BACT|nr:MAG: hypothetical protein A2589_01890 [Candidatus Vogelbacteria bacterium RIFOXYD1_FULL_46_19]